MVVVVVVVVAVDAAVVDADELCACADAADGRPTSGCWPCSTSLLSVEYRTADAGVLAVVASAGLAWVDAVGHCCCYWRWWWRWCLNSMTSPSWRKEQV